jgi:mRNA-degrading endonuclease RelE of RelBE toxin-antitoxin system
MQEPSIHYHDSLFRELKELDERKQMIIEKMKSDEILITEVQMEFEDDKP